MTRTRVALICIWAVWSAILWRAYAHVPPSPDHSTFDYAGWILRDGGTIYVDVIEQNWPGAMWVHTLSASLFGSSLWSFRALDYLLMLAAAGAIFVLLRSGGNALAAWIAVPLYQAMYVTSNQWFAGQRDIVGAHLLLIGTVAYRKRALGGHRAWLIAFGFIVAFVTLTRPTYLLYPALLVLSDLLQARRGARTLGAIVVDGATVAASAIASLGVVAGIGATSGSLVGWYEASVLFNTQLYSQSASVADVTMQIAALPREGWHWYIAFTIAGAIIWWRRGERSALAVFANLFLLGLVSYYVQLKEFGYHLGAWLPAMAACSAEFIAWSVAQALERLAAIRLAVAFTVCLIAVAGSAKKLTHTLAPQLLYATGVIDYPTMARQLPLGVANLRVSDAEDAAQFIRQRTNVDDTVLVWGRGIAINVLAHRRMPVPYATIGMLDLARPPFTKADAWVDDFERVLAMKPPAIVFAPTASNAFDHQRLFDAHDATRASLALRRALAERYTRVSTFGPFDAYLLRGPES